MSKTDQTSTDNLNNNFPLVSYIVLSYNQEKYIADAVSSALNQSYSNIEYIISDDCSTDHTFSIIQKACNLSKKNIKILKNEVNVGLVNHLNNCLKYASGDLIVLAAGDDIAILDRVKRTVDYFLEFEDVNILSFNDTKIINGKKTDDKLLSLNKDAIYTLNDYITGNSAMFPGASRAFRREVFDIFGNLLSDCPTEDTPYLLRGLMTGKALISCKPGIHYRLHDSNLSSHSNLIKMNFLALQNQFEVDLKTAKDINKINADEYIRIKSWIKHDAIMRNLMKEKNKIKKYFGYFYLLLTSKLFRKKLNSRLSRKF